MYRPRRKALAVALVVASLGFHLVVVALYTRLPDSFAAFTLLPIWFWGSVGLSLGCLAFFLRAPLALFSVTAWSLTILILADEARPLGRLGRETPHPGIPRRYEGRNVIRAATINWAVSPADFSEAIRAYQPDIIFIQEMPHPYRLRELNRDLFGGRGDYRYDTDRRCGIVVRGEIERQIPNPFRDLRSQQVTARLPGGRRVELVNVHLKAADEDLALWKQECWRSHRLNRRLRRDELSNALGILGSSNPRGERPALVAGDFNAPAGDSIYRIMEENFIDTFGAVGTGWGNTYHRRLPVFRLDHIFASRAFRPVRSRVVSIPESDHRMLISDLILQ
jgi:endonuclease/exonuclease/phosphatase family metal-dependent hydrolase